MEPRDEMLYNAVACLIQSMVPIGNNQDEQNHEKTMEVIVQLCTAYAKTCACCLMRSKAVVDQLEGAIMMRMIRDNLE